MRRRDKISWKVMIVEIQNLLTLQNKPFAALISALKWQQANALKMHYAKSDRCTIAENKIIDEIIWF